jgi:hypothetical protein
MWTKSRVTESETPNNLGDSMPRVEIGGEGGNVPFRLIIKKNQSLTGPLLEQFVPPAWTGRKPSMGRMSGGKI